MNADNITEKVCVAVTLWTYIQGCSIRTSSETTACVYPLFLQVSAGIIFRLGYSCVLLNPFQLFAY
jgi:hypothetical protein